MSKRMSSKLAKSLRQARAQRPAVKSKAAAPKKPSSPAAPTRRPTAPAARGGRFARQSDQSPPLSLDRPWANLHPERIWPD